MVHSTFNGVFGGKRHENLLKKTAKEAKKTSNAGGACGFQILEATFCEGKKWRKGCPEVAGSANVPTAGTIVRWKGVTLRGKKGE